MSRKKKHFFSVEQLEELIAQYFTYIKGQSHTETREGKDGSSNAEVIVWDRKPEPPTLGGLSLYLGFESRDEYAEYELKAWYAWPLKRARLQIETEFEKKLHDSSSGAIYALRSMRRDEKNDEKPVGEADFLRYEIVNSGPAPVSSEKDAVL